jgi:hypothetical protein
MIRIFLCSTCVKGPAQGRIYGIGNTRETDIDQCHKGKNIYKNMPTKGERRQDKGKLKTDRRNLRQKWII